MMDLKALQEEISKNGKVGVGGDVFGQTAGGLFGTPNVLDAQSTIAAKLLNADQAPPKSTIVTVGEARRGSASRCCGTRPTMRSPWSRSSTPPTPSAS